MATKMGELRELGDDEILTKVAEIREQLFKKRWQAASGQAENPRKIRVLRRDIARHLTVLRERRRAGEKS